MLDGLAIVLTMRKAWAERTAGEVLRLPRVMICPCQLGQVHGFRVQQLLSHTFSAMRAASLAFGKVVLIISWWRRAETRFL